MASKLPGLALSVVLASSNAFAGDTATPSSPPKKMSAVDRAVKVWLALQAPGEACQKASVQRAFSTKSPVGCLDVLFAEAIANNMPNYMEAVGHAAERLGHKLALPPGVTREQINAILKNPELRDAKPARTFK